MAAKTALEQLQELQADFEAKSQAIKERAGSELAARMGVLRSELASLERQYSEITGKPTRGTFGGSRGPRGSRTSITIEQVKEAIKAGAKNYPAIAEKLGCSPANVASKIKKEGKAAGIKSKGTRATFELFV